MLNLSLTLCLIFLLSCEKKENPKNKNLPPRPTEREISPETDTSEGSAPRIPSEEEIAYYYSGTFLAKFETLNPNVNGNVPGSSTIHFSQEKIYAYVRLFGGSPSAWHQQKIYNGSQCPTIEDDLNGDGFLDIEEVEKVTGDVLVPLDANISSQKAGTPFYPIGDISGNYFYERVTRFESMLANLQKEDSDLDDNMIKLEENEIFKIEDRPIVIYGINPEAEIPITVSGQGRFKPYQTFPVACGIFKKVLTFPGTSYDGEIPGPIEEYGP